MWTRATIYLRSELNFYKFIKLQIQSANQVIRDIFVPSAVFSVAWGLVWSIIMTLFFTVTTSERGIRAYNFWGIEAVEILSALVCQYDQTSFWGRASRLGNTL